MSLMTKKRKTEIGPQDDDKGKEPYPSRKNTRYAGLPVKLYAALARYAKDHSDEDEERSISWAARVAIRKFLSDEGYWPPPEGSS